MNISASLRFDRESGMVTMDADKNSVSIYNNLSNNRNSYSPNQMLLLAMGSCASADVLSILTKMHQDFTDFRLKLDGERFDSDPMVLKSVDFKFDISGQMAAENVQKAIDLTLSKYCSATILARLAGTNVTYSLTINQKTVFSEHTPPPVDKNPFTDSGNSAK
ncbi:MAG: hypothetical protein B2I17_06690 [Thermoplasmatales archaeon B_DKE]|nr:MAG: hypothetical protein B2I17_06690 [Thermoplasmatales archaeon B_DKE]